MMVEQLLLQGEPLIIHQLWGALGLAPSRLSKQWGMDILPMFLLRLGSSRLMWIASLGLSGDLRRFFVNYIEVLNGRKRVMEILAVF